LKTQFTTEERIEMRVICPKCQFENQADQSASRVVCARCATIIDVGMGLESNYGGGYGNASSGATGGGFGGNYSGNYEQTIRPGAYPPAPVNRPQLPEGDVYATRIDDDFDDVLDIPRPNAQLQSYQYNDNSPAFDDVFSTPGSYDTMVDSRQPAQPFPSDNFQSNAYQQNSYQQNAYQANPYDNNPTFDSPNYGAPQQDPEFMGWPVLPEDTTDPGIPPTSAFSKRGGLLKGALALVLFGALALFAYSWLGGGKTPKGKQPPAVVVEGNEQGSDTAQTAVNIGGDKPATGASNTVVGLSGSAPTVNVPPVNPVVPPPSVAPATGPKAGATVLPPVKEVIKTPPAEAPKLPAPAVATSTTPNRGNITIQAGSYNDMAQANDRVAKLKAANETARVVTANIPGKGTWYRVQIGRFPSREQAASYATQLRAKNLVQEFLVTPAN
jgi:cell division septation protein DedD